MLVLTRHDAGRTLDLNAGEELLLVLEENPSTGFRWEMSTPDEEVLTLQNQAYESEREAGVGAGGRRIFRLTAQRRGTTALHLRLRREWGGEDAETLSVVIRVRSDAPSRQERR